MGTASFPGVKCGRGVLLTILPLLVSQPWKSRAKLLPTLWVDVSDDLEQMWKESLLRQDTTATFAWGAGAKLREISSTITGLQTNNRTLELPDTKQHFYPMNRVVIIENSLGQQG